MEVKESSENVSTDWSHIKIPYSFKCPISCEVMTDPVKTCDGQVFQRQEIEKWFRLGHRTSPMTGLELKSLDLKPIAVLRCAIAEFVADLKRIGYQPIPPGFEKNPVSVQEATFELNYDHLRSLILEACEKGHGYVLEGLLEAAPEAFESVVGDDYLLHNAVANGHDEVVSALLQAGLAIDSTDANGSSMVHLAATKGHAEVIAILHSFGAKIDARDRQGLTPLECAVAKKQFAVIDMLVNINLGALPSADTTPPQALDLDPTLPSQSAEPDRCKLWDVAEVQVWYKVTSRMAQRCKNPGQGLAIVQQRWIEAQLHITADMKAVLQEGLDAMKAVLNEKGQRSQA